jgi:hypothetical protein
MDSRGPSGRDQTGQEYNEEEYTHRGTERDWVQRAQAEELRSGYGCDPTSKKGTHHQSRDSQPNGVTEHPPENPPP